MIQRRTILSFKHFQCQFVEACRGLLTSTNLSTRAYLTLNYRTSAYCSPEYSLGRELDFSCAVLSNIVTLAGHSPLPPYRTKLCVCTRRIHSLLSSSSSLRTHLCQTCSRHCSSRQSLTPFMIYGRAHHWVHFAADDHEIVSESSRMIPYFPVSIKSSHLALKDWVSPLPPLPPSWSLLLCSYLLTLSYELLLKTLSLLCFFLPKKTLWPLCQCFWDLPPAFSVGWSESWSLHDPPSLPSRPQGRLHWAHLLLAFPQQNDSATFLSQFWQSSD